MLFKELSLQPERKKNSEKEFSTEKYTLCSDNWLSVYPSFDVTWGNSIVCQKLSHI